MKYIYIFHGEVFHRLLLVLIIVFHSFGLVLEDEPCVIQNNNVKY